MDGPAKPRDSAVADALAEISRRIAGEVRADPYSLVLYSTDASIYRATPLGVVIPRSVEDLQAVAEIAAARGVPLLPRAAGSSLAGQAVNEALVVDVSRHLDRVLEIDAEARTVRVEPGIVLDELNLELAPLGLQFGPDPASSNRAALGGVVSNNSTGSHSIRYGMTADHVLEVGAILADGSAARFGPLEPAEVERRAAGPGLEGSIYRRISGLVADEANRRVVRAGTPRHWRRCGGYNLDRFVGGGVSFHGPADPRFNLAKLVCGAEGTLAVITDVTLGLVPRPEATALAIVHFERLGDALAAVPAILETDPSAVELIDDMGLALCRGVPQYARLLATFLEGEPHCVLLTEFEGSGSAATGSALAAKIERLRERLDRAGAGATAVVPILEPDRQADVWTVRKVALGLLMSVRGDHKPIPFIEDAAVPVEHLAAYVAEIERFCAGLGTRVAYYAHASAGCVHIRPLVDTKTASEIAKLPEITAFSVELLQGYGGALSSEHGDGRARSWINERFFGPDLYRLYREVKAAFDPENRLNPGNVVDGPPMTESLRFSAGYRTAEVATRLDWSRDLGFARAVEMCNGAGVCRKRTAGTMCPSFMVTREEEHSTRGRANLLRAALSGELPAAEMTGRRMYEAMELCVECKACKAECPSSVDMAKLKFEFLAAYRKAHGVPLRARLFAGVGRLARLASGAPAPAVNRLLAGRPLRAAAERLLGVSRRRRLPPFARVPFTRWFAEHARFPGPRLGEVALFHDTFATYHQPEIAIAATRLLAAAGYRVRLPGHRCCGRPMISQGLFARARAAAADTVARLAPFAERGVPIVGLEPSCLSALRDDYADLLPGDPGVERVAAAALGFEEFVASRADAGRLELAWNGGPRRVLLHGHCHQKALVGTAPARRALELPPGYEVEEVDSGCCGMAGAFGYEREHYEISMAMGERRLLPAVRAAAAETIVAAAGVSCRQQILDGAGRRALHPAEVLERALAQG